VVFSEAGNDVMAIYPIGGAEHGFHRQILKDQPELPNSE
jgi:hypothetical protein